MHEFPLPTVVLNGTFFFAKRDHLLGERVACRKLAVIKIITSFHIFTLVLSSWQKARRQVSSIVSLSYLIVAVPMPMCLGKRSCLSFTFHLAIEIILVWVEDSPVKN